MSEALERWGLGLTVGHLAHALAARPRPGEAGLRNRLRVRLIDLLTALGTLGTTGDAVLRTLPISTLRALTHADLHQHLPRNFDHARRWREALESVSTSKKVGRAPLVTGAQFMAHLLLEGDCSAAFLARCGRAFLGDNWKWIEREEGWTDQADLHLERLRSDRSKFQSLVSTEDRIETLQALTNALPSGGRQHWRNVENAVLQQLFAWPLLVDQERSSDMGAYSIPVAVDVIFDGRSEAYVLGSQEAVEQRTIDASHWQDELARAAQVGRDLWRSKHGGISHRFRDLVMSSSVQFDFRTAASVMAEGSLRLALFENSMGPYFAQVVLHRLLGRSHGFSAAITGRIGQRRRFAHGAPGLDYEFEPAGSADLKLRYVFEDRGFPKVVLPVNQAGEEKSLAYKLAAAKSVITEVNYCRYMSNVADAVQPSGWRQYHYIRAPEIVALLHTAPEGLLPPRSTQVQEVARRLSTNRSAVLELADVEPLALLSYLHQVNGAERAAMRPAPASLSWTFVRAVEEENDRRLWATIWGAIGGSREDFLRLRHATCAEDVARMFARAMNTFSPGEASLSHRAPDLLVVMAARRLAPSSWKRDALNYRSHIFPAVVGALKSEDLLPSPIEPLRRFMGATRLIILDGGEKEIRGAPPAQLRDVDPRTEGALSRLRTFRFGFTQQMASVLLSELNVGGMEVRELLRQLTAAGRMRFSSGQYWVTGRIGAREDEGTRPGELAQRHWAAAKAIAPSLGSTTSPGLDLAASFLPQNIHEASFHLERAAAFAIEAQGALESEDRRWKALDALRQNVRIAHNRLIQFLDLPSPGMVQNLTRDRQGLSSRAAWDLARQLLREKEQLRFDPAPQELTIYAGAGAAWLDDTASNTEAEVEARREDVREAVRALYLKALYGCRGDSSADRSQWLSVLTHYGLFLMRHAHGDEAGPATLDCVRQQVDALTSEGTRSGAVQAKWFEGEGDRAQEGREAASQYRMAVEMSPKYIPCWIKLAGVCAAPELAADLAGLPADASLLPEDMVRWARRQRLPLNSGVHTDWMNERWGKGISALQQISG